MVIQKWTEQLTQRLEQLYQRIEEDDFIDHTAIGSDIPHYVFDYPAEGELIVRDQLNYICQHSKRRIVEINLSQLLIELFQDDLDDLMQLGDDEGLEGLWEAIGPVLDTKELEHAVIDKAGDAEVLLMTGVGNASPFVRSSKTLKRLSELSFHTPIILFYPGKFTGLQLKLFGIHNNEDEYQLTRLA